MNRGVAGKPERSLAVGAAGACLLVGASWACHNTEDSTQLRRSAAGGASGVPDTRVVDADAAVSERVDAGLPSTERVDPFFGPIESRREAVHGAPCSSNDECDTGLECIASVGSTTRGEAQISNGICSRRCEADEDCSSLDDGSTCRTPIAGGSVGYCTMPCSYTQSEAAKCLGRRDMFCYAPPEMTPQCVSACTGDHDCPESYRCDYGTGQCQENIDPVRTTPLGGACEAEGPSSCQGYCVGEEAGARVCTGSCRTGSVCGGSEDNVCVPGTPLARPGDLGLCGVRCTDSSQCVAGVTECGPTGFRLEDGSPEQSCTLISSGLATYGQTLPSAAMERASLGVPVLRISTTWNGGPHRLFAKEGAVCVEGSLEDNAAPPRLRLQFGDNEGNPLDASAYEGLRFRLTTNIGSIAEATRSDGRGGFFRMLPTDGILVSFRDGENALGFDQLATLDEEEPWRSWDSSQLQEIIFVLFGATAASYEFCISNLELGSAEPRPEADADVGG